MVHEIHSTVSYSMGTSGLPDVYIRGLQAQGLRVYIRQITSSHGITTM